MRFASFARHLLSRLVLAAGLGAAACSSQPPSTVLTTQGFDVSCDVDTDCVVVEQGDQCGCCGGTPAAINVSGQAAFQQEASARRSACGSTVTCFCPAQPGVRCGGHHTCALCSTPDCAELIDGGGAGDAGHE